MSVTLCWSELRKRRTSEAGDRSRGRRLRRSRCRGRLQRGGRGRMDSEFLATDRGALEASLGTELSNTFEDDRPPTPAEHAPTNEGLALSSNSWSGAPSSRVGRRRGNKSRSLCRRRSWPARPSRARNWLWPRRDAVDRVIGHGDHRFDRRGRLPHRVPCGDRPRVSGAPTGARRKLLGHSDFEPWASAPAILPNASRSSCAKKTASIPAMQALVGNLELVAKRD